MLFYYLKFLEVSIPLQHYQQLSLNPQKLAGQCGKLKCCFGTMMVLDALNFPDFETKLVTEKAMLFVKQGHLKGNVVCLHNFANWHVANRQNKEIIAEK
jgi:cell fate regulator YaaT (PSP1 superfamily)